MRRTSQLFEIFFKDKIVELTDNWYIIYLVKLSILKVNIIKNLTSKIWHICLTYLSYETMKKLLSITLGMKFKSTILLKICKVYMVS